MGVELGYDPKEIVVENVHLGDSLMILNYKIASRFQDVSGEMAATDDAMTDLSDAPAYASTRTMKQEGDNRT